MARSRQRVVRQLIGGYSVARHDRCRIPVPTLSAFRDTQGWLDAGAASQAIDQVIAFHEPDRDVRASDFRAATDTGAKGVDSVAAAYAASHGSRDDDTYALHTGPGSGGCKVFSNEMRLGDGMLRYLFLSTCKSVPAVRPDKVWLVPAHGVRAIFGYCGKMQGSSSYGEQFFANWNDGAVPFTQAFLLASHGVNPDQTPVAAWFGATKREAELNRDSEARFLADRAGTGAIAYQADTTARCPPPPPMPRVRPFRVEWNLLPALGDPRGLLLAFQNLAGNKRVRLHAESRPFGQVLRGRDGSVLVYRRGGGGILWRHARTEVEPEVRFPDNEAIRLAETALPQIVRELRACGALSENETVLRAPCHVRRHWKGAYEAGWADEERRTTGVTVGFRIAISEVPSIGPGGLVELTFDGASKLAGFRAVVRPVAAIRPLARDPIETEAALRAARLRARREAKESSLKARVSTVSVVMGIDTPNEHEVVSSSELSIHVLLEVGGEGVTQLQLCRYPVSGL